MRACKPMVRGDVMNKKNHRNSDGWKMVATAKGVSTFERKSKLHQFLGYAPVWLPALLLLPVLWKDPKAYWIMLSVGSIFGAPLCWTILHIPIFSVNNKMCCSGVRSRWATKDAYLMLNSDNPDYIYVFNKKKGIVFPVWRSSEKNDRDLVESYLSRFIPKDNNDSKENS
jgi:hypothetical protein